VLTSLVGFPSSRRARRTVAAAVCVPVLLGAGVAVGQVAGAWTEFQGGPSKTGVATDGPDPGYRRAWSTPIDPGGPGDRFGLSAPVIAGDVAVAVGPDAVIGVDLGSGEQTFAVDRAVGPSVPAGVAPLGDSTAVVYTEGWGEGPPPAPGSEVSPTASASPATTADGAGDELVESHLAAFDLGSQERLWPPVPLGGVSRTGVTVDAGAASSTRCSSPRSR
jgi:hypothetical protein